MTRTFKTVKELATFENPPRQQIQRLQISARSDDFKKRATIELSGSWRRGISLNIDARDDVVTRLRSDILDVVGGLRPWYGALHRVDFVPFMLVALFLLWFGLVSAIAFKWLPTDGSKDSTPSVSAMAQVVTWGVPAVCFVMGIVLNRFRDSVFPGAVFLIGQAKGRFAHVERIQWGIVIAFVVSLVAGLVIVVWQAVATK